MHRRFTRAASKLDRMLHLHTTRTRTIIDQVPEEGGCPIYLKGAPEVERRRRRGVKAVEGLCPLRKKLYFLYQNGEFLCIPGDIY